MNDANLYELIGDPRDDINTDFLLFTIAIHRRDTRSLAELLMRFNVTSMKHNFIIEYFDLETETEDAKAGQDESVLFLFGELWRHWMNTGSPRRLPSGFNLRLCAGLIAGPFSRYGWGESIAWLWEHVMPACLECDPGAVVRRAFWNGVENNHYAVVGWAIKNGAPIDESREDGEHPITLACKCRADAAIELLLEAECDLTVTDQHDTHASDLLAAYYARM